MNIKHMQDNWNKWGETDPLYAILTYPEKQGGRWQLEEFFETGTREINDVWSYVEGLGISLPRQRALDFGCGVGRLTQALARYFNEVCGVDVAPSMIELARKYNHCGDRCLYFVNARDDLAIFPSDHFDFIYTNITLQHIEPCYSERYIEEFCRVLAREGVLIFQLLIPGPTRAPLTERVKSLIPYPIRVPLLSLYRLLRYGDLHGRPYPRIDMYGIKRESVLALLRRCHMKVVDIRPSADAGPSCEGFRYCVTKE